MALIFGNISPNTLTGTNAADKIWGYEGGDFIYALGGNDTVYGGSENDYIEGGTGDDDLFGQEGVDVLHGQDGDDRLVGGAGDDSLYGGADNDILEGGLGADYLQGSWGSDIADYRNATGQIVVSLDAGRGWLNEAEGDTLFEIEHLYGSNHTDWLQGDDGFNLISGFGGDDWIQGLGGNDNLRGGDGKDYIEGGSGKDYIDGGDGDDDLYGDSGADHIYGAGGNDELYGGEGNDLLKPGLGDGHVSGGREADWLIMHEANHTGAVMVDLELGLATRSKISLIADTAPSADSSNAAQSSDARAARLDMGVWPVAEASELGLWPFVDEADAGLWPFVDEADAGLWPFIREEAADEALEHARELERGGEDVRAMEAEAVDFGELEDIFGAEAMAYRLELEPGFEDKPELFVPDLPLGGGYVPMEFDATWEITLTGIEFVIGGNGNDVIKGDELYNYLQGGAGNDHVMGRGGDDFLMSTAGIDSLDGGDGDDLLISDKLGGFTEMTGGAGSDTFEFWTGELSNPGLRGAITDFEAGESVKILDYYHSGLEYIGDAAFDGTGPQLRVEQTGASAIVEIDASADGAVDWWIEMTMQDANHMLGSSDFVLL